MVLSPTVNVACLGQGHSETISDRNLHSFTLDLLDTVRRQKFTECTCAPEKQTPGVLRNGGTEAARSNLAHWNVRDLVNDPE